MRVRYIAPFGCTTGYAVAAANNAVALSKAGVEVSLRYLGERVPGWLPPKLAGELEALPERDDEVDATILHAPLGPAVEELAVPGALLYTTWETSRVPEEYERKAWAAYLDVAVPSRFSASAFRDPVAVIPHCFERNRRTSSMRMMAGLRFHERFTAASSSRIGDS